MNFAEIIPLTGIRLNDKLIALSSSREEVEKLLGTPHMERGSSSFYFDNELRFDFEKDGNVKFIEFLSGVDGKLQPQIYGVSAFQTGADDLYDILAEKNNGDISDHENGYCYGFLNISVGLFRNMTPEAVEDMIEEAEDDGEPMDDEEIAYEMRKADHWATIGIGVENYYR